MDPRPTPKIPPHPILQEYDAFTVDQPGVNPEEY
jgi:hypothetical protein